MNYRKLGSSDVMVSELSLGTMTFGEQNTEEDAHAQLDFALSYGVNFNDTAEMYPVPPKINTVHKTESYIGSWLKHQVRDQIILASKITGPARGFDWIRNGPRINRTQIFEAIEGSLKRLQTDYLDLYQIHWPDRYIPMFGATNYEIDHERENIPIAEQLQALGELVQQGKIRYIGLSNETPWGVMEFVRCAKSLNLPKIVSIQNSYHLMNRQFETGLAEVCRHLGVGLLGYSPLAFGLLSGKYLASPKAQGRFALYPDFCKRYKKPNVTAASKAYQQIAEEVGLSLTVLALAFARTRWFMSSIIIGATHLQQLRENLESAQVHLPHDVVEKIEKVHQLFPNPAP